MVKVGVESSYFPATHLVFQHSPSHDTLACRIPAFLSDGIGRDVYKRQAHSPGNDRGVIPPTAALSSIPYTPEYSLEAMRYFYEELGDRLWGEYGFKDAFNLTEDWFAPSYLAIDQGPIIVMIENYRTGLIWKLFMSHPDVQKGLKRLGFTSPYLNKAD